MSCGLVLILIAICLIAFFCGMCCFKKPEPKRSTTDVPDPPPPRQMNNNDYQRNQNYDNNTQVLTLEEFRVSLIYGFDIQNQECKIIILGEFCCHLVLWQNSEERSGKMQKDEIEGILSEEQTAVNFKWLANSWLFNFCFSIILISIPWEFLEQMARLNIGSMNGLSFF